jgi:hypothetical protein
MLHGLPLVLLLAAGAPAWDARDELDVVATRIEQLKARHMAGQDVGRELTALLVRAQDLVAEIERREARPPMPAPAPASELRERADALHDEADRIAGALVALDSRIAQAHRTLSARVAQLQEHPERTPDGTVVARRAALSPLGSPAASSPEPIHADEARLRGMLAERARLAHVLVQVWAQAAAVEAEARAAER